VISKIFDPELKKAHRDKAARLLPPGGDKLMRSIAVRDGRHFTWSSGR